MNFLMPRSMKNHWDGPVSDIQYDVGSISIANSGVDLNREVIHKNIIVNDLTNKVRQ